MKKLSRLKIGIPLILLCLLAFAILSVKITEPWGGGHDGASGVWYGVCAKNHLRYGLLTTKFGHVLNAGIADPNEFIFFIDHPPLVSIFIAISFAIFGIHEWSARLMPIAFSLGIIVVLYFFVIEENIVIITFFLTLVHIWVLKGLGGLVELYRRLIFRLNILGEGSKYAFTFRDFVTKEIMRIFDLFTLVVVLLSLAWFYSLLRRRDPQRSVLILLLFLFGLMNILIFVNGTYYHNYKVFFLIPAFAISAALGLDCVLKKISGYKKVIIAACLAGIFLLQSLYVIKLLHKYDTEVDSTAKGYAQEARDMVEVGKFIKENSGSDEAVIASLDWNMPIGYYSDRNVFPSIYDGIRSYDKFRRALESTSKKYRFYVVDKASLIDDKLLTYLSRYNHIEIGNYTLYNLKSD